MVSSCPFAAMKPKKVLLLGSGGLFIGQAGEFDYSGSQAIKALKEEGVETILINPNIATVQTSKGLADKVYFLPVRRDFVEKVIEKEQPDGILLSFGGQTALNCGVELERGGVFKKHGVRVLGTPITSIVLTEDRKLFSQTLQKMGIGIPKSSAATSVKEAVERAETIGYPVIVRGAYALGGRGSGFARNGKEVEEIVSKALSFTDQVLIEESLKGWKEVEYEVVRDRVDNCITVCNMENVDPLGIHTGESIVVAPSQTLDNEEYHRLREISIKVIRELGIVGECNIQFALNPESKDVRVIEVNARLSRSSALASKATGYPLAFVAAKLALGYSLPEIENSITKATQACFEPALDYIVVKIPKWDLAKFRMVSKNIGSGMKSVGEVMAIGRSFEEGIQKALRMVDYNGFEDNGLEFEDLEQELANPSDKRIYAINKALKKGYSIEKINQLTHIDPWFLHKLKNIVECEKELIEGELPRELLLKAKKLGFSDLQIGNRFYQKGSEYDKEMKIRDLRKKLGVTPFVKQIDTLAAEYPAKTNYLYLTYHADSHDIVFQGKNAVAVLGSGAYKIGSSVEFDYCCVRCVQTLKSLGYETIMINYNPETVSTDYDICDKLYFEELSLERVLDIYELESPLGMIISMGGQIPNNLAVRLEKQKVTILGTPPESIDTAENRHRFSSLLDSLGVDQPEWKEITNLDEVRKFVEKVKFPVLIRPSYVLSGAAMNVADTWEYLDQYLKKASQLSKEFPVVISKFITEAKEIEMDAVAKQGEIVMYAISEHIENAGVHSGDATLVFPAQKLYVETIRRVKKITREIAKSLNITGPFNIQFLAKDNDIKVIECNLRASRSFPFVSKVLNLDFIEFATKTIMDKPFEKPEKSAFDLDYVGVKAPMFSFSRLEGADPILGVEMASTGEVACLGEDVREAFLNSYLSVGYRIPKKGVLLSTGPLKSKGKFIESARSLQKGGYKIFATRGTGHFLQQHGVSCTILYWPLERREPNVLTFIKNRAFDLAINIPKSNEREELTNDYLIRRAAVDHSIPLITNLECAMLFIDSLEKANGIEIKSWEEYIAEGG